MYTDEIACNWLEGVRIMSLYYMHGTQRYISIIHLEKNDLQSAQRLLGTLNKLRLKFNIY